MNTRRVHDLMRDHFPRFDAATLDWTNIIDGASPSERLLDQVLRGHIAAAEVLVEVHRKLGAVVPLAEAARYISAHVGQGQIKVADRHFKSFVVVAQNGVATGWHHDG